MYTIRASLTTGLAVALRTRFRERTAAFLTLALGLVALVIPLQAAPPQTREYWIAAEDTLWDYAPSYPVNLMTGEEFTDDQKVFVEFGIGRQYYKVRYVEYTVNFTQVKGRPPEEQHLGILGPLIRATVGDTIVVHFRNNSSIATSVHPHGVLYDKNSEGTPYDDGTGPEQKGDDIVPPDGEHTYVWQVPERAGPGPSDPSSVAWPDHGHVDEPAEVNAGLIGAIVITRRGQGDENGRPLGIDREFVSLFSVFDENSSSVFAANLLTCPTCDPDDDEFIESNLMHGINGLVYGNNQGYVMHVGDRVRWHVMAMGTEVDLHSPHWHGVTLLDKGSRIDVTSIIPAQTKSFDLFADNAGTWMYHCHVNDHITAGMMTKFTIVP